MRVIGTIQRLQIQPETLKTKLEPPLGYNPEILLEVDMLKLTTKGFVGLKNEQEILDVHHQEHPRSRNRKDNDLSFNFISHYQKM
ncbi:MAG: hypothetical protein ACRCYY_12105 [Trueperaceae bacterium]